VCAAEEQGVSNLSEVRARAVQSFRQAVRREKGKALRNAREAKDRWPEDQEQYMEVQAALAAGLMANRSRPPPAPTEHAKTRPTVALEETLASDDGLLKGGWIASRRALRA
jgi:hypothetical protein